jgi:hypothetical protein
MGQVRRAIRKELEVGFPQLKPPLVHYHVAGQQMARAAEGATGIKEAIHAHLDPIICRFCQNSLEQVPPNGQKRPLRPREVWAIRVRLQLEQRRRDLALFNLAIDSKLRGCDLVRLRVSDVCVGDGCRTVPR